MMIPKTLPLAMFDGTVVIGSCSLYRTRGGVFPMHYPEYKKQLNQMEQEHRLRHQGEELKAEHQQQEQLSGGRVSRRTRLIAYLIVLILIILAIMVVVFVFH